MGENRENKNPKFRIREQMLVIVNKDWHRTYVASIHTIKGHDGRKKYSAKCKLKESSIVGIAYDKDQLSRCMDELATIIEEYTSRKLPFGIPLVLDIIFGLN